MFYSEHNPPHFHVKYQEYEGLLTLLMVWFMVFCLGEPFL
jgi:hypothetical protein